MQKFTQLIKNGLFLFTIFIILGCDVNKRDIKIEETGGNTGNEIVREAPILTISAPTLLYSGDSASMSVTVTEPDGVPSKLNWVQISGTPITISNPAAENIQFNAPPLASGSENLVFEVTATPIDKQGFSTTESITIDLYAFPLAVSASNRRVSAGQTVTLHGLSNASADHAQTVLWTQVSGTQVTLVDANTYNTSFTAPDTLSLETLVFNLSVNTEAVERNAQATVIVEALPVALQLVEPPQTLGNSTPILTEKTFQVTPGSTAHLVSVNPIPDGSIFTWNQLSGAPVIINNPETAGASFIMPPGQVDPLVFQLSVTSSEGVTSVVNQKIFPGFGVYWS